MQIRTPDSKSTRGNRTNKQSNQGGRGKRLEANPSGGAIHKLVHWRTLNSH
jgi:hypothetical protein